MALRAGSCSFATGSARKRAGVALRAGNGSPQPNQTEHPSGDELAPTPSPGHSVRFAACQGTLPGTPLADAVPRGGRISPYAFTFARAKRRLFRLPLPSVLEPLLASGGRRNPVDAERTREPGIRVRRVKSMYRHPSHNCAPWLLLIHEHLHLPDQRHICIASSGRDNGQVFSFVRRLRDRAQKCHCTCWFGVGSMFWSRRITDDS